LDPPPFTLLSNIGQSEIIKKIFSYLSMIMFNIIQLMTFDEVNTRIDQPMEHDIHQGIRGEYHVPWVDQSLYSPKLKVINCFII
jgi:hypothetical protein